MSLIKSAVKVGFAGLFVAAGVAHFTNTEAFMKIMPPSLPWHRELVQLSGVAEIAGGVGLLIPQTSRAAALGLAALLIAVFPANVYMATAGVKLGGFPSQPWMAWARLPLQAVFLGGVLWSAYLVDSEARKTG